MMMSTSSGMATGSTANERKSSSSAWPSTPAATGFDAPHVDLIAVLRPTESVSLYQQIVGRGLRLSPGKEDCLILDYTGQGHDLFRPEIEDDKPAEESVPVQVECPACKYLNDFWGLVTEDGDLVEHFGRKCRGAEEDPDTGAVIPCGFRFRFKNCPHCGEESHPFGSGGAEQAAAEMGVPFLGRLPLSLAIREASDAGRPPASGDGAEAEAFARLASKLLEAVAH